MNDRSSPSKLALHAVTRSAPFSLTFYFDRYPTDDEMQWLSEAAQHAIQSAPPPAADTSSLRYLDKGFCADKGCGGILSFWRSGETRKGFVSRDLTIGEWLSDPPKQGGVWHIDAGQGAPLGAMVVVWDYTQKAWRHG